MGWQRGDNSRREDVGEDRSERSQDAARKQIHNTG